MVILRWPLQCFRLSSCADAEAREVTDNVQRQRSSKVTAAEAKSKWVFVHAEVSLFSKKNVCFHLNLKSQSRDKISVPLSDRRHRVRWRCLWRARSLLGSYCHFEKGSGMNCFLFTSPFPCPYFTGRFFKPFALLWNCFLAPWFPSKYDCLKALH